LLVAIREMAEYAPAYAAKTVQNARALGKALDDAGIDVEGRDFGYTDSHQIAVNVAVHGGGLAVAQRLEESDIIVNYNLLPNNTDARNPSGLRIGVQEMTRFGMGVTEMQALAELMAAAIRGRNVKDAVNGLRAGFVTLHYV
jgi:glycine hydroxymethyltransferase